MAVAAPQPAPPHPSPHHPYSAIKALGLWPPAAAHSGLWEEDDKVVVHEDAKSKEHREGPRAGPAGDPVFFLLTAVAVTMSMAFMSMLAVAIPRMRAMKRAANSLCLLSDAAIELPSTMAAVRLSGMEISDITLELSDLSHEIADGVNKSAKVAEAVQAGIGQMGDIAWRQTMSMIKEQANLQTIPSQGQMKSHKSSRRRQQKGPDPDV